MPDTQLVHHLASGARIGVVALLVPKRADEFHLPCRPIGRITALVLQNASEGDHTPIDLRGARSIRNSVRMVTINDTPDDGGNLTASFPRQVPLHIRGRGRVLTSARTIYGHPEMTTSTSGHAR